MSPRFSRAYRSVTAALWGSFRNNGTSTLASTSYAGLSPEGKNIYVVGSPEDLQLQQTKNISQWGASITVRYSF